VLLKSALNDEIGIIKISIFFMSFCQAYVMTYVMILTIFDNDEIGIIKISIFFMSFCQACVMTQS